MYQSFGDLRVLAFEALVSGMRRFGIPESEFGLQTKWSQPIHKDWLLGEILVGHFWPRPDAHGPHRGKSAFGGQRENAFLSSALTLNGPTSR